MYKKFLVSMLLVVALAGCSHQSSDKQGDQTDTALPVQDQITDPAPINNGADQGQQPTVPSSAVEPTQPPPAATDTTTPTSGANSTTTTPASGDTATTTPVTPSTDKSIGKSIDKAIDKATGDKDTPATSNVETK